MPMKTTARSTRIAAGDPRMPAPMAPLRMVNSLTKGPNGGEPVTAKNPPGTARPRPGGTAGCRGSSAYDLPVARTDVAGREEEHPLGEPVVDQVQQRAVDGHAAEAEAQHQDAHVLDAGVGQHPLEVALRRP